MKTKVSGTQKSTSKKSSQASPSKESRGVYQEALDKWGALNRIRVSPEYQDHLRPILLEAQLNKWPDPIQDKFSEIYKVEYARAKAYGDIQAMIDGADTMLKNLTKQKLDKKAYEF